MPHCDKKVSSTTTKTTTTATEWMTLSGFDSIELVVPVSTDCDSYS
jgi:hypothetical protein